jgi:AraC-like DNA-binding protein
VYSERPEAGFACAWEHTTTGPHLQRVVPDGCIDVIWSGTELQVAGPNTSAFLAEMAPGSLLVGLRLRPGTAPPVLGVPADALRDGQVPLRELWGPGTGALEDALSTAADPVRTLAEALERHRDGTCDPMVPAAVALLGGAVCVRDAARALGLSERQLRRRSLASFGYGPKMLQRILRFQRALRLTRQGVPYAEVACTVGYADQAHLAHEIRELGGAPLSTLL